MATRSSSTARSRNASSTGNSSGLNLSRAQEKEQLETLNNRLAVYIDTVRRLEQDNRELKVRNRVFLSHLSKNSFGIFILLRVSLHRIAIHMKSKHPK